VLGLTGTWVFFFSSCGPGPRDFEKSQPATHPALHEYTIFGLVPVKNN
jgi:hypothetical protein